METNIFRIQHIASWPILLRRIHPAVFADQVVRFAIAGIEFWPIRIAPGLRPVFPGGHTPYGALEGLQCPARRIRAANGSGPGIVAVNFPAPDRVLFCGRFGPGKENCILKSPLL
jgi:hypothetical protein